jgi:hypothetical protein
VLVVMGRQASPPPPTWQKSKLKKEKLPKIKIIKKMCSILNTIRQSVKLVLNGLYIREQMSPPRR